MFLIESDEPLIRLLAWLFVDDGFEVASFSDRAAATERYGDLRPCVVIFNSGETAGRKDAAMVKWREVLPSARFIDIHERALDDITRAGWSRADAHFEMPFDADELIRLARALQL